MAQLPNTNVLGGSDQNLSPQSQGDQVILSEQHVTPEPCTLAVAVVRGTGDSYSFSLHWTVRLKVTQMTDRTAAILLKVLVCDMLFRGIDFTGYLSVEYLVNRLMRSKLDPMDIRDEKDRQAVLLGTLILASVRGTWLNMQERLQLPPSVIQDIYSSGWLPNTRTLKSWSQYHQPRTFLEILTVPLDTYDQRSQLGSRYSSYCKGYGNGGHVSRTEKTRYSAELDGDDTDREPPELNLLEVEQYCRLLLSIEREKIQRYQDRE